MKKPQKASVRLHSHTHELSPDLHTGVVVTGHAALDVQGSEAVLSVDTSDEPYGLLTIAPSSLRVSTEERERTLNIYVNREFGASGQWTNFEHKIMYKIQEFTLNRFLPFVKF